LSLPIVCDSGMPQFELAELVEIVTEAGAGGSGGKFGAFFYNQIDENGEAYRPYKLAGAPRSAFADFEMPRKTEIFASIFNGLRVLHSDDIRKDPLYDLNGPHFGMPKSHLSAVCYLAVAVISRAGIVHGGILLPTTSLGNSMKRQRRSSRRSRPRCDLNRERRAPRRSAAVGRYQASSA
jgi:hypothetical protein